MAETIEFNSPVVVTEAPALFEAYYDRINRYLQSMVRDPAEAEDLTQETFLRSFRERESLREPGAALGWLYRIATHVALDRLRRRARRAPLEADTDLDQLEVPESDRPTLQQTVERDEMSGCVQRYLNRLSDSYRAVILLHDTQELTDPEIAQLLGESLATIKIRLHRARRQLRTLLGAGCAFSRDERSVLICESKH